jgi:transposase InsO family protein
VQANISTSGFYYWLKHGSGDQQFVDEELIQLVFHHRKSKAGARTIKMLMARHFWMTINLKKVRRIMKKYDLKAIIRRKNKYRFSGAAAYEHKICKNHLKRAFKPEKSDAVYSTDITYLNYGEGKAYLSAVKDLGTKEILNYRLSRSLTLPLAIDGVKEMLERLSKKKRRKLIIHSDQGLHYTSHPYRSLLKKYGVIQSMSRRGNCLDNAPIESFFGHMKDNLELPECRTFKDLAVQMDQYMNYYNNERPQWGLKGKTPAECRGFS